MAIVINTDGGSRGNPGPAGIGAVIREDGVLLSEVSSYIGEQTNNYAEYEALVKALETTEELVGERLSEVSVEVRMDSELIVKQMKGEYKVKDPTLKEKNAQVHSLITSHFPSIEFVHVPRAENAEADALVNAALDSALL